MKKIFSILPLLILTVSITFGQSNPYPATPLQKRLDAFQKRQELRENSLLKNVELRSVGPTIMSGRVSDIDANPEDPTMFYVAYASGGLWKTENNGISFTPFFDNEASMTIGDIAVDWKHGETIWVGTGENNSSRSSYAGTGIYKSSDKGKTWQYSGLGETQHTGKIIIDLEDPNTVWVASIGHLYSPNSERGIYKTIDGGKTWRQTLFIDDNTGVIDLAVDPNNFKILYAAAWYRTRRAWNFEESGKSSGIYKSEDGGETWKLVSTEESGFPTGNGVGRIGLAVYPKNSKIIYAVVDNQAHRPEEKKEEKPAITKEILKDINTDDFLKLKDEDINKFLDDNNFPREYSADKIKSMVKENKIKPSALVDYISDANDNLFNTPVIGAEVYRSEDAGKTWKKANEKYLDDLFYTYGYYFGLIRVDPENDQHIYIAGVPILKSENGGKTFKSIDQDNMHGDYHALWVDPNKEGHLIIGNDGGLNISYDNGKTYFKANTPAVGQFYSVAVDMAKPYNVYGGLQDNGVWTGPSTYSPDYSWYASGKYPFKAIMGGDGMQVQIDTTDNTTVYTGFQFGNYYRVNKNTGDAEPVTPERKLGEPAQRFNWQSPIKLSPHNRAIFYIGANKLYRSLDQGKTYEVISGDLTKGAKKGDVPFGTLTSIDESPLKFGLLYTGSDDGLVYLTKDGGGNWLNISAELPQDLYVSRVSASFSDTATVYVSLNGYRWDDFNSYIYKSINYGTSWEKIGTGLPSEPVNVIKEDPHNSNILYVGTDHALYVSLDGGLTFMGMNNGMPDVPVHDLVIQPRDKDIIIGTHGRSIYIGDVSYIEKLDKDILSKKINLFPVNATTYNKNWGKKFYAWSEPNTPETKVVYYSGSDGISKISIMTDDNKELNTFADTTSRGLNFFKYDFSVGKNKIDFYKELVNKNSKNEEDNFKETDSGKTYLRPGKYKLEIEINGAKDGQPFEIKEQKVRKRGTGNDEIGTALPHPGKD